MTEPNMAKCPACSLSFELDSYVQIGDITTCPNCDTDLEVINLDPPEVEIGGIGFSDDDYKEEE